MREVMARPSTLEIIAQKEQELRGLLLEARARADALVVEARREAAQVKAREEATAAAEVKARLDRELLAVSRTADLAASRALAEVDRLQGDLRRSDAAAQLIVDAVLLRPREITERPPLAIQSQDPLAVVGR